jgi:ubiquinone/menaquinone biosynthesis C-methylase UbiE
MKNALPTSPAIEVPGPARPSGWHGQFARPTGMLGRVAGHVMALRNKERSWWVLPLLEIGESERLLEVGFGSGIDIRRASDIAAHGFVAGIDHSEVMLEQARRRNASGIRAGRVELQLGLASRLPYPDDSFDKVFSINVAQFWTEPLEAIREMRRVLRPSGLIGIAVQPRSKGGTKQTAREMGQMLVENLRAAGFSQVRLESKKMKPVSVVCGLGVK